MKFNKSITSLLFMGVIILSFSSCKRSVDEDIELDLDTTIIKVDAEVEVTNMDIDNIADQAEILETVTKKTYDLNDILSEATVTKDTSSGLTYDTLFITVDFGNVENEGIDGRLRKGIIYVTSLYTNAGIRQERIIETENYYFEKNKIELTRKHTYDGVNSLQNHKWAIENDLTIHYADGLTSNRQSQRTQTWLEGATTLNNIEDDKWEIEGTDQGTRKDGKTFTTQTSEPLIFYSNCKYIQQGKIKYLIDGGDDFVIDYGAGSDCDNKADIIVGDRSTVITID